MKKLLYLMLALTMALSISCSKQEEEKAEAKEEILVGVISDLSGPTSAVGAPYAEGVKAAAKYINEQGGVNGKMLKLEQVDYAYNVQQALAAYKKFKSIGVVAIQGWGTGDTEALVKSVAKDKIPYFSASYSAHLTDPANAPYNFFIAPDYSTQLRAGLDYFKSQWKESRAPRIVFMYPDHPYGLAPIPAGKEYAVELGFDIVGEEIVSLKATEATTQLLAVQKEKPDFIWCGGTTPSTAVIMKDAKRLNMDATFLSNIWASDENIFKLAGDAAEGNFGLQGAVIYGQDVPGMKVIEKMTNNQPQMTHYIRGFASVLVMAEAMKIADSKGTLNGAGIKAAAETMRDFDPMGLTPPISYFPDDHRPTMSVNVFQMKGGKLTLASTQSLERKKEWLGK